MCQGLRTWSESETLDLPLLEPVPFVVVVTPEMFHVHMSDLGCSCWGWKENSEEKVDSPVLPVRGARGEVKVSEEEQLLLES